MLFVHRSIQPLISEVTSSAVACGMADTLGNKGGVGISFCLGSTRFVIINSHLAANQNKTKARNSQFHKICSGMTQLLKSRMPGREQEKANPAAESKADEADAGERPLPVADQGLVNSGDGGQEEEDDAADREEKFDDDDRSKSDQLGQYGDRVLFMGDMNYRINGNRFLFSFHTAPHDLSCHQENDRPAALSPDARSAALERPTEVCPPLLHPLTNFSPRISMAENQIPSFFKGLFPHSPPLSHSATRSLHSEAPLNFYPTYKLDIGSNEYDSGPKKRIPSWTDRILFKPNGMKCLAYDSVTDIMISDHRPVYGSFLVNIVPSTGASEREESQFVSESQVCRIM
jgi:hypothetical protein